MKDWSQCVKWWQGNSLFSPDIRMLMMEEVSTEHFIDEDTVIKKVECPMKGLTKGNVFIKISKQVKGLCWNTTANPQNAEIKSFYRVSENRKIQISFSIF